MDEFRNVLLVVVSPLLPVKPIVSHFFAVVCLVSNRVLSFLFLFSFVIIVIIMVFCPFPLFSSVLTAVSTAPREKQVR